MVDVGFEDDRVIFDIRGWHKLWAFKSRLVIQRAHIVGACHDPSALVGLWKGFRLPGTYLPGAIVAGSFYRRGRWTFYDVADAEKAIVVELEKEKYAHLIIEVEEPRVVVEAINAR